MVEDDGVVEGVEEVEEELSRNIMLSEVLRVKILCYLAEEKVHCQIHQPVSLY